MDDAPDETSQPREQSGGGGDADPVRFDDLARAVSRNLDMTAALASRVEQVGDDIGRLALASAAPPPSVPPDISSLPNRVDDLGAMLSEIRLRLGMLDSIVDRVDRMEELVTAVAQQLAEDAASPGYGDVTRQLDHQLELVRAVAQQQARDAEAAPAATAAATADVTAEIARRMDDLRSEIHDLAAASGQSNLEGQLGLLVDRLSGIETIVNQVMASTSGPVTDLLRQVVESTQADKDAIVEALTQQLTTVESRIDGELDGQLQALETLFSVFGEAMASKVGNAVAAEADTNHESLRNELYALEERLNTALDEITGAVTEVTGGVDRSADTARSALATIASTLPRAVGEAVDDKLVARLGGIDEQLGALPTGVAAAIAENLAPSAELADVVRRAEESAALMAATAADLTRAAQAAAERGDSHWQEIIQASRDTAVETTRALGQATAAADRVAAETAGTLSGIADRVAAETAGALSGIADRIAADAAGTLEAHLSVVADRVADEAAGAVRSATGELASAVTGDLMGALTSATADVAAVGARIAADTTRAVDEMSAEAARVLETAATAARRAADAADELTVEATRAFDAMGAETARSLESATSRAAADAEHFATTAAHALEAISADTARALELATSETRRANEVAERAWADATDLLQAVSGETARAVEAASAGAQQATDAARAAGQTGERTGELVRTQLTELRERLDAALDQTTAGVEEVVRDRLVELAGAVSAELDRRRTEDDAAIAALGEKVTTSTAATREAADELLAGWARTGDELARSIEAAGTRNEAQLAVAVGVARHAAEDSGRLAADSAERMRAEVTQATAATREAADELLAGWARTGDELARSIEAAGTRNEAQLAAAVDVARHAAEDSVKAAADTADRMTAEITRAVDRSTAETGRVLDVVASDLARALEVSSDGVRQAADAAREAGLVGQRSATVLRTELVGLRQGLKAALAELASVVDAQAREVTASSLTVTGDVERRVIDATSELQRAVADGNDLVQQALHAVSVELAETRSSADQRHELVAAIQEAVSARLADLVEILDQRQGGIEQGMRDVVGRLDGMDRGVVEALTASHDSLMSVGGSLPAEVAEAVSVAMSGAVTGAVTGAVSDMARALQALDERLTTSAVDDRAALLESLNEAVDYGVAEAARNAATAAAEQVRGIAIEAAADAAVAAGNAAATAAADQVAFVLNELLSDGADALTPAVSDEPAAIDTDFLDETVRQVGDALVSRLEAISSAAVEASSPTLGAPDLFDATRAAVADSLGSTIQAAVDEAVASALKAALESLVEDVKGAARDGASDGRDGRGGGEADGGDGGPTVSAPDVAASMVSVVATALDEFGGRVDRDITEIGARLQALSDVLGQVVSTVEEVVAQRRGGGPTSEAFALLRQVAAEAGEGVRTDNARRRSAAAPPAETTPPVPADRPTPRVAADGPTPPVAADGGPTPPAAADGPILTVRSPTSRSRRAGGDGPGPAAAAPGATATKPAKGDSARRRAKAPADSGPTEPPAERPPTRRRSRKTDSR